MHGVVTISSLPWAAECWILKASGSRIWFASFSPGVSRSRDREPVADTLRSRLSPRRPGVPSRLQNDLRRRPRTARRRYGHAHLARTGLRRTRSPVWRPRAALAPRIRLGVELRCEGAHDDWRSI